MIRLLPAVFLLLQAVISVQTELVAVPVAVTDARGHHVSGTRIRSLARQSDAVIYAIGLLGTPPVEEEENAGLLKRLCRDTGGVAYFPQTIDEIVAMSTEVARDLREQYTDVLSIFLSRPSPDRFIVRARDVSSP